MSSRVLWEFNLEYPWQILNLRNIKHGSLLINSFKIGGFDQCQKTEIVWLFEKSIYWVVLVSHFGFINYFDCCWLTWHNRKACVWINWSCVRLRAYCIFLSWCSRSLSEGRYSRFPRPWGVKLRTFRFRRSLLNSKCLALSWFLNLLP